MQIGAGDQGDMLVLDLLGIVDEEARIRISLVRRMAHNPVVIGHERTHAVMHLVVHLFRLAPLLQFHDDDAVPAAPVGPDDDEIHPLGSLGDVVLYRHLHVVRNLRIIHDVPHELHRIVP